MKVLLNMMQVSAETLKVLVPGHDSRVVWQEFGNKLAAFELFENVDSVLNLNANSGIPLSQLVEKTYALETYHSVWATEGLGHYQTEMCWDQTGVPRNLLRESRPDALPARSLTALHAGMGLSLSNRLLKGIGPGSSKKKIRDVLQEFVNLARDNSRPGYVGAAYEAFGLVTRLLYPHLVQIIDGELLEINENQAGYFWHGVGRAIYFTPTNFLPFNNSPWRAVAMAQREPTHETGRLNALAGLVWAMFLVNIRHPEILETLLKRQGSELSQNDALSNGVSSAIMIWRDSTDDESFKALFEHQPKSPDPAVVQLWTDQILQPCESALRRWYPVLKKHDCLGEVFRYQSLPDLVARLETGRGHDRRYPVSERTNQEGAESR